LPVVDVGAADVSVAELAVSAQIPHSEARFQQMEAMVDGAVIELNRAVRLAVLAAKTRANRIEERGWRCLTSAHDVLLGCLFFARHNRKAVGAVGKHALERGPLVNALGALVRAALVGDERGDVPWARRDPARELLVGN